MVPRAASPRPTWSMKPVIVWMLSSGESVRFGVEPAAMATIIVSPTTRAIASRIAAMMPGERRREDDAEGDLEARRAEAVRRLAQVARHVRHRVLGDRGDGRQDHHGEHDEAGAEGVEDRHVLVAEQRPQDVAA